jgi:hypothetical protein
LIFGLAVSKNAAMFGDFGGLARRLALSIAIATMLGCLPAGDPPKGRHLVADRGVSGVVFSPSPSDPARSHLLVSGPTRESPSIDFSGGSYTTPLSDLYQFDASETASPTRRLEQEEPVVRNLNGNAMNIFYNELPTDSRGRLILQTVEADPASGRAMGAFVRYDPDTRVTERLVEYGASGAGALTFSPGRTRALLYEPPSGTLLIELDGQQQLSSLNATFVGEDLYYVAGTTASPWERPGASRLMRVQPGGTSEVLIEGEGYISLQVIQSGETKLLLVQALSSSSDALAYLLDPTTLALSPLPSEVGLATFQTLSPDRRRLLFRASSDGRWLLYDRSNGSTRTLPVDPQGNGQSVAEWRPDTDELWLGENGQLTIWRGDGSVTVQASPSASCLGDFRYRTSMFNRDGSLWFSATWTDDGSHMAVGWTDHPETPPMPIQLDGTWVNSCWELEGHRLLVEVRAGDTQDTDLYLFDPSSGDIRPVAGSVRIVQAGQTRVLGLLQWEGWRAAGQLALIDYATGARTRLADDVAQAVVDHAGRDLASGVDPLAPGTRVAFISRNRLDSPYDGLWLTELP